MQFQAQAWAPGKKTSGGAKLTAKREKINEHVDLFHFWYLNKKCRVPLFYDYDFFTCLLYSTTPQQYRLVGKRALDIVLKMGKEVNMAPPSSPPPRARAEHM